MKKKLVEQLAPDEQVFVYSYLAGKNMKDSAMAAGKPEPSAGSWGARAVKKPHIAAAIAQEMEGRRKRLQIDADWVLMELKKIYDSSLAPFIDVPVDKEGKQYPTPMFNFANVSPEQIAFLDSISISQGEFGPNIKITKAQKLKVLELIGKHVDVQAFKDKVELDGNVVLHFDIQDSEA